MFSLLKLYFIFCFLHTNFIIYAQDSALFFLQNSNVTFCLVNTSTNLTNSILIRNQSISSVSNSNPSRNDYSSLSVYVEKEFKTWLKKPSTIAVKKIRNCMVSIDYVESIHSVFIHYMNSLLCDGQNYENPVHFDEYIYYHPRNTDALLFIDFLECNSIVDAALIFDNSTHYHINVSDDPPCDPYNSQCFPIYGSYYLADGSRSDIYTIYNVSLDLTWYNYTRPLFCGSSTCHLERTISFANSTAFGFDTTLSKSTSISRYNSTSYTLEIGASIQASLTKALGLSFLVGGSGTIERGFQHTDEVGTSHTYRLDVAVDYGHEEKVVCDGISNGSVIIQIQPMILTYFGNHCIRKKYYNHKNVTRYLCKPFYTSLAPSVNNKFVPSVRCLHY